MNRLAAALAAASLAVPALASAGPWGDGHKTTQPRETPAFTAIRSEGSLDVDVRVGPARSVSVTIDENLQRDVETVVQGDTLVIRLHGSPSWRDEGKVTVTVPSLTALLIKGSGDASIVGATGGDAQLAVDGSGDLSWSGKASRLKVRIDGSGDVSLAGQADALEASVQGSGDVDASALTATSAQLAVNGSGDIGATLAGGALEAQVNGSGDIHWRGSASPVQAVKHGSGDIVQE